MKIVYSQDYAMEWGEHVFPAEKYHLLYRRLLKEDLVREEDVISPPVPSWQELALIHEPEYLEELQALRASPRTLSSEIPLNPSLIRGTRIMCGGTYLAAILALKEGIGFHLGGGLHHAYPDHAEGFCYLNDLGFALAKLKNEGQIRRAAVVDCDLHQGNGTAFIFRHDPEIFTFSIHQEFLYPFPKEESDLDIGLAVGTGDEEYLLALEGALERVIGHSPELVIYQAGVDPYREDLLGDLALSEEGLRRRDEMVIGYLRKAGIPVAITLGGGYPAEVEKVVELHLQTFLVARSYSEEAFPAR